MNIGKLSPEDLSLYLRFIPLFEKMGKDVQSIFHQKREQYFSNDALDPSWFYLYELPFQQHIATVLVVLGVDAEAKAMATTDNPPKAALESIQRSLQEDEIDMSFQPTEEDRNKYALIFGLAYSMYLSFQSLLAYGLYLNELVALVAKGGKGADKALLNAIKVDPTVISCKPLSARISQAVLEDDQKFLNKLRRSFLGKKSKSEHKVYQQQRVILQVLLETGASKLSAEDLYVLFVEQLKITTNDRDSDIGDVAENLRQFAYQFVKQKSVSQK